MIGGGQQGRPHRPSQAGFDDTPGAIDLALKRVDPNGLSGEQVKARILLAGGWERMGSNQCRAKGWSVLVGSQGAPNEIKSGSGDGVPSKLCPRNHTGCGVDPESRALSEAGAVLFRSTECPEGGLMTCYARRDVVRANGKAKAAAVSQIDAPVLFYRLPQETVLQRSSGCESPGKGFQSKEDWWNMREKLAAPTSGRPVWL